MIWRILYMQLNHFVSKLLDLSQAVEPIKNDGYFYLSDQLILPFIGTSSVDYKKMGERLKIKILYKNVDDINEKYGNTLELIILDDEPVLFYTRGCKWMDTYSIYHITDELTEKYTNFLFECRDKEDLYIHKDYMTDELLTSQSWFGKYKLFEQPLPIEIIQYP